MSQACGNIEFMNGGTLQGTTVIGSQITESRLTNCTLDGCEITNLRSIDANSMNTIAQALMQAIVPTPKTSPASTNAPEIPTTILGGRDAVLGRPLMFAQIGQFIIPIYSSDL